ncbi:MAG: PA14 domain-containing protein [Planctomycetes bacterium]|nr:PA14 domain-containing protein [Planctomycetota bacterium]
MSRKLMYLTAVTAALLVGGVAWAAHDVTMQGDPVQGVPNDGVSPGNNNAIGWPGNEGPDQAIDNQITTKFLHFKGEVEPTGIRVTPKSGPSVVTGLRLCTANDAIERDPVGWELSGSNNGIGGPYTLIAKGPITDFVGGAWPRRTWNTTAITFENTVSYTSYQLMLTPVQNPGSANSMQIAEVELLAADLVPLAPKPANKAQGVTMPLLQWTPGDMAQFEDVYVGTSPDLTEADRSSTHQPAVLKMNYYAKGLVPGTTYYWRVDDIDSAGKVYTGNVWSFTASPLSAYSPSPRDGDKWLAVTSQLSWQPGQNGIKHDLFFGTDKAKVEARDASVGKGTLTAPMFDPGALTQNTTYYWVVDETTTTGTKNPGQVWSFTTIGSGEGGLRGDYFVGNAPSGEPALSRIDKTLDIQLTGTASPGAPIPGDNWSARWTADLEVPVADTFQFSINCQDGTRMWIDGQMIIDKWVTPTVTSEYFALPVTLDKGFHSLVVEFYEAGGDAYEQLYWSTATMAKVIVPAGPLQPPYHAVSVYPGGKAVDVPQQLTLSWKAGEKAATHDVYFGDNAQAVADATPTTADIYKGQQKRAENTFDAGTLEWNKTYYWRIDEVNDADAASPWKGNVWSFTTANFIVVDNMETYTDDEGNRIYETWVDGLTNGQSNSVVGNDIAPFAEVMIVNNGRQSLPLTYDNTIAPFFSEAQREFAPAQDWTVNGMNTLVLALQGAMNNGAGQVYATLEDSAGKSATVANPDAAVMTAGIYSDWKVPLSSFAGVDLTKIKKIYIGVGDRKAPKAGGAGKIYVDDIRVIKQ